MSQQGQRTSQAERVEIGERWKAGQSDPVIAQALQRPLATVRKWRRRYQCQGRTGLSSQMGRPKTGALGQFDSELVQVIDRLRKAHPGWGPITIGMELQQDFRLIGKRLPSRSRIAAYLHEQGLTKRYERHQKMPEPPPPKVERPNQEWEVDAQGIIQVKGLGGVSILNIVDVFSHLLPGSLACAHKSHANTQDHQLLLRCAFLRHGLPELISLDHDTVFYDSQTGSPFPTLLHLWLIGLGIAVRFIHLPPPAEHARIERTHQIVTDQAVLGQTFTELNALQDWLTQRLDFLNQNYPSRASHGQPPLTAFPQAQQSPRPYHLEWEAEMLDLRRVYAYLAKGCWFRRTTVVGEFSLGAQRYNAGTRYAKQTLEITFDPRTIEFVCLPETDLEAFRFPARGLSKEVLMGELNPLLHFSQPYQLALPFSLQDWRELILCSQLTDTTL